jgi:hypothetical protein
MKKILCLKLFKKVLIGLYIIIAFEVLFRVFSPVPIIPRYVTGTPFGIRGNMPNMNYWHKSADFKINIRTNSRGIRSDEEIAYEKPEGLKRIVVLGDSFGMGYEVNIEDTFLNRMNDKLEKHGKKVQIINLSVSGHGNAEELIMLENEGIKYHPDIILLCWHASDFDDNVRSDLFSLKNGELKRKAATYLPGIHISDMLYKIPLFIPISENSHIYNKVRDKAGEEIQKILVQIQNLQSVLKGTASKTESKETAPNDYPERLMIALIKNMYEQSKKVNAKFIILDLPLSKGRYKFYSAFPKTADKSIAESVVNPIDMLRKNIVKGELFINEHSHFHFTPKACRIIGDVLAAYILDNKLL